MVKKRDQSGPHGRRQDTPKGSTPDLQNGAKRGSGRWRLYILQCGDGSLYTGITNDLARRVAEHNRGTASRCTRSRLPVALVHQEPCRGRSGALKKEYAVKQLSRSEKEAYISARKRAAIKKQG